MKYMLLIYQNPTAWAELPEAERTAVAGEATGIWKELAESGEWVGGDGLLDPAHTRTVRVRGGVPTVTDGPFVESTEQLARYLIVDCEAPERAVEIAGRWPDARYWPLEVRPLMQAGGADA